MIPDNTPLRGLLKAIQLAYDAKNADLLSALADSATVSIGNVVIYTTFLREELLGEEYRVYKQEDGDAAKERLEQKAYGNFIEAATALAYDAQRGPFGKDPTEPSSRKFRVEFFEPEDQIFWNETYPAVEKLWEKSQHSHTTDDRTYKKIRAYLQKYLGELRTSYIAHYVSRKRQEGTTARLLLDEAPVRIESGDIQVKKVLEEQVVSDISQLPKQVGDLELQDVTKTLLFDHEL